LGAGSRVSTPERLLAAAGHLILAKTKRTWKAAGYMAHQAGFGQEHVKTK